MGKQEEDLKKRIEEGFEKYLPNDWKKRSDKWQKIEEELQNEELENLF